MPSIDAIYISVEPFTNFSFITPFSFHSEMARPICKHLCYDFEDLMEWNIPGADHLLTSPLNCINSAAYTPTYPEIIKEFWGGVTFDGQSGFSGQVLDYLLTFNHQRLCGLLQAEAEGSQYTIGWNLEMDQRDINKTVFGREFISNEDATMASNLTREAKLIHVLICSVFCPRISLHTYVLDNDVFIIYHTLKKLPIDPVDIVHKHLRRVMANTTYAIPYGFLLTKILQGMTACPFAFSHFARDTCTVISRKFLEREGIVIPSKEVAAAGGGDDDGDDDDDDAAAATQNAGDDAGGKGAGGGAVGGNPRDRTDAEGGAAPAGNSGGTLKLAAETSTPSSTDDFPEFSQLIRDMEQRKRRRSEFESTASSRR